MEVTGKIKTITETVEVGSSGFKKRDIVITTDEQYPQSISIQFVQDKCSVLDSYQVGQSVTIGINLRGREWVNPQGETVYFNTIQGWKIAKHTVQSPTEAYEAKQTPAPVASSEDNSDLPF